MKNLILSLALTVVSLSASAGIFTVPGNGYSNCHTQNPRTCPTLFPKAKMQDLAEDNAVQDAAAQCRGRGGWAGRVLSKSGYCEVHQYENELVCNANAAIACSLPY